MKTGRKDYGRGSRRPFRALLAGFFVLFLALLPLGAWPTLQEGTREDAISISEITAMRESAETAEEVQLVAPPLGVTVEIYPPSGTQRIVEILLDYPPESEEEENLS